MTATSPVPTDLPAARLAALLRADDGSIYRRLIESVRDYAIFFLTPSGHIASWSPGAQRIKGWRAEEIVGRHFSTFYTPADLSRGWPDEELRRAAADGRLEDEGWRLRRDGSRFWANVVITALRDAQGELLGYAKVTRDLTERRQQEERLRESEDNLRLLVEGVKDHAMYLLDGAGRFRTWNSGAQHLLGYAPQQALGQDACMLHVADDRAAGRPASELAAARAAGFFRTEGWRQRADGSRFWAEVTTTHLTTDEGATRGYVQIVRDLTERRRVEALEAEGRRIAEFIAMLSHELRNPLAPIVNAVSLLDGVVQDEQARRCVALLARQAQHLTRLVDDLLDVSRITRGKIRLEPAPLDADTLVRAAVEAAAATVQAHGHTLTLRTANRPLALSGDPTRLTQVIVNLINNAAKYTPAGGRIEVSVSSAGDVAVLQVADTGIGMDADLLQRAFDPFVQGARTLDRADGGLGIGLTLVRHIVELHGGAVTVASPGVGRGTTFTVTLPLVRQAAAPVAAPAAAAAAAEPAGAAPCRVLVVDDNVDAADSLALLLQLKGHEVGVAHDGPQALAVAAGLRPQVAVLDIGLPGMDGYEVARRLRQLPGLADVQLVALTGYGQPAERQAALDAGFTRHFTKPVDADELARCIG